MISSSLAHHTSILSCSHKYHILRMTYGYHVLIEYNVTFASALSSAMVSRAGRRLISSLWPQAFNNQACSSQRITLELQSINECLDLPRNEIYIMSSPPPSADAIADSVLSAFDRLPKKFQPRVIDNSASGEQQRREWVPLAGIVLSRPSCVNHGAEE
jgi:hypothetical protein